MADAKTRCQRDADGLPIGLLGGAGANPLAPTTPLVKAVARFMPPPRKPQKRKTAFRKDATAFSKPTG
jgi:hypothetical protein